MHERTHTCTKSYMIAVSRTRSGDYSYSFESCVRGYHVYQTVWVINFYCYKN